MHRRWVSEGYSNSAASLGCKRESCVVFFQELQQKIAEVKQHMESVASRRKHIAEGLSGRLPDQAKTAEQMQDDLQAATDIKVGSVLMVVFRLDGVQKHLT